MVQSSNFTKEEVDKINDIKKQYANTTVQLGQVLVEKTVLESQLSSLQTLEDNIKSSLRKLIEDEKQFIASLNGKYGDGILNLENGTFTKANN